MELVHAIQSFDLKAFLTAAGPLALVVIFAIIFAENGLFLGFFLPATACCSPPASWRHRESCRFRC